MVASTAVDNMHIHCYCIYCITLIRQLRPSQVFDSATLTLAPNVHSRIDAHRALIQTTNSQEAREQPHRSTLTTDLSVECTLQVLSAQEGQPQGHPGRQ